MKKNFRLLLLVSVVFFAALTANSQDVIVKKDNTTILSKITKITTSEIEYKKWSNLDGPVYVIEKSELLRINFQSGEVEDFSIKAPLSINLMERKGRSLTLDGRFLSDEEVKSLVTESDYDTYLSARNQIRYGDMNAIMFGASFIASVYLIYYGIANEDGFYQILGLAAAGFADLNLVFLIINKSAGKGRLAWIADEYNNKHRHGYSLNLSPSVIKFSPMQSQNNYALGMTLRLNF